MFEEMSNREDPASCLVATRISDLFRQTWIHAELAIESLGYSSTIPQFVDLTYF